MLLHIPKCFTPELFALLMRMGHGETILLSDANYPALSTGKPIYFLPGYRVEELLKEMLYFFPLDDSVPYAATVMESAKESDVFDRYAALLRQAPVPTGLETVPRFAFYERAEQAVGIVVTSDTVKGGNILIQKGVVR